MAGLAAAHGLSPHVAVTLFEADARFGGHTHTVDVTLDGLTHGVDTGFLVFNERTYPRLIALFARLGVDVAASEMSFSVQARGDAVEWSGHDLAAVFAQKRNLLRPRFWQMLVDVLRFNRLATALARTLPAPATDDASTTCNFGEAGETGDVFDETTAQFLDRYGFSNAFREWYLLPMIGCIWSCPTEQMLRFPIATLVRFCDNHGLLQVADRPAWFTVRGGARNYVAKMLASIGDARLSTPVRQVARHRGGGVDVITAGGTERFDAAILACHSDQSLRLLAAPSEAEQRVLGAIRYQSNRALLHTDVAMLPSRPRAWAAWNYERAEVESREHASVCLHYLINRLQPLPFTTPVIVSLNPVREPDPARVLADIEYAHPVFDRAAVTAQSRLGALQGQRDTWFCGAWTRYGFHEDALMSGEAVAAAVLSRLDQTRQAVA